MLLIISILFIIIATMKFYGFNIIHRIKKIDTDRTENKKKYDGIISLDCSVTGIVIFIFYLNSSRWLYGFFESELLWHILVVLLFISICLIIYAPIVYREGSVGVFLSRIESSTKKRKVICGCYIADAILIIMLVIWKVIKCTDYGIPLEFYFLGVDTAIAVFICTLLIIISLFFIIAVTLHKKKVIIFITTAIALFAFNFSLFICAWTTGGDYYSFYSPNLNKSILIEEWTHLITEDVRVYERENIFFIRKIGSLPINSVHDFQQGNYDVEWKEKKVVITLHKGSNNEEICEFDLGE
ncbi:MAG: hypothetical protein UIM24_00985 [Clostridia bacterium]|nr:hypothetical protein [Clostridia bacterium]